MLLVLALDLPSWSAFEALLATLADVTFFAILEVFPSFSGGLVSAIPRTHYTLVWLLNAAQEKWLSLTTDRHLQAKDSPVFRIDPISVFVGDPSSYLRLFHAQPSHNHIIILLFICIYHNPIIAKIMVIFQTTKHCFYAVIKSFQQYYIENEREKILSISVN